MKRRHAKAVILIVFALVMTGSFMLSDGLAGEKKKRRRRPVHQKIIQAPFRIGKWAMTEVNNGASRVGGTAFRVIRPIVPKKARRFVKKGMEWKARAMVGNVAGMQRLNKGLQKLVKVKQTYDNKVKPFERVASFNQKVSKVRGEAREFAGKIREKGIEGQHKADKLIVKAVREGYLTPQQGREAWRQVTEKNKFAHAMADKVDGLADRINGKNVILKGGEVLLTKALPAGLRAMKGLVEGGGKRKPESGAEKREPGPMQKVARELGQVSLDAFTRGAEKHFMAKMEEKGEDYLVKRGIAEVVERLPQDKVKDARDAFKLATGVIAIVKGKVPTDRQFAKADGGDIKGAVRDMGKEPPKFQKPDAKEAAKDAIIDAAKAGVKGGRKDFGPNFRKETLDRLDRALPGEGEHLQQLHDRWKKTKDPKERLKIAAEITKRLGVMEKQKQKQKTDENAGSGDGGDDDSEKVPGEQPPTKPKVGDDEEKDPGEQPPTGPKVDDDPQKDPGNSGGSNKVETTPGPDGEGGYDEDDTTVKGEQPQGPRKPPEEKEETTAAGEDKPEGKQMDQLDKMKDKEDQDSDDGGQGNNSVGVNMAMGTTTAGTFISEKDFNKTQEGQDHQKTSQTALDEKRQAQEESAAADQDKVDAHDSLARHQISKSENEHKDRESSAKDHREAQSTVADSVEGGLKRGVRTGVSAGMNVIGTAAGVKASGGGKGSSGSPGTSGKEGGTGTGDGSSEDTSHLEGVISGHWQGDCGEWGTVSGTFRMNISGRGGVGGSYSGDESGSISGTIDASGKMSAVSGVAGEGNWWKGTVIRESSGILAGNGGWGNSDCKGSWRGVGK